ncbi:OprD family porin [Pseudomonas sp. TTU2014-080ASC]|uniref:OprD family porin n=1 Tax=Pseudomonas sp. TTU2014-080ASC TaxID=1729724 RepID=UPI0007184737|nr:OprD family porin [Pseudomonas sp. TTU2014-080ASC]KRW60841.1 porin [Pseudomonas sp. TTU2014-080ASC]
MKYSSQWLASLLAAGAQTALANGFIEDSKIDLNLRNFYFNNDNRESQDQIGKKAYSGQNEEWGQAFILTAKSGFTQGTVGVGVDALGTFGMRLDGGGRVGKSDLERTPGQLFPLDSDGSAVQNFSRLGLTVKAKIAQTEIRHGTLQPRLPILVSNDGRLLPQTFEGTQLTSQDFDNLTLTGGLIEQATGRSSSDRTGLAVSGGSQASNHLWFGGADWQVKPGLQAQYYYANLEDYYRQHFLGLTRQLPISEGQSLKLDLRYFRTTSDGANASASGRAQGYLVNGYSDDGQGEIDNHTWSAALTHNYGAHSVLMGYQQVSDKSNFVQANQGSLDGDKGAGGVSVYLLTDRQLHNFTRAGERTRFAEYSYDFAGAGVPGLKASVAYLKGTNIQTSQQGQRKEWERDFRLDYTIQSGPLQGVNLSWRNASLRSETVADTDQNRFITSYSLPFF